jgi:hypothetical protein
MYKGDRLAMPVRELSQILPFLCRWPQQKQRAGLSTSIKNFMAHNYLPL